MYEAAINRIKKCLSTRQPYLDLDNLDLNDSDFDDGSPLSNFLSQCEHIERLNLGYNQLKRVHAISGMSGLRQLAIGENQITDISSISHFSNLELLYLRGNQITDINSLSKLIHLKELYLGENKIVDISSLSDLVNLNYLSLEGNQINEVGSLSKLIYLKKLYIENNQVTNISPLVSLIGSGVNPIQLVYKQYRYQVTNKEINVYGNPLSTPPVELVQRGNEAVLRYFSNQLEPAYEAKLLVVGEPEAGKTSLIKKLVDPIYKIPSQEDSTIGIQVLKWQCLHYSINQQIKVNIWDFGGQEMQYLTHQFFLSSDALYILLTSARKDFDNLDYWFNIISLLGKNENNQNSELLVVANEINMQDGQVDKTFDEKKYKELYPHLPFTFRSVNLSTFCDIDRRFQNLTYLIKEKLVNLPVMGRMLPVKWGIVRGRLAELKLNYLRTDDYLDICRQSGVEENFALDLSNYMHKIGEAVHFQNDYAIDDHVILNPKWAVDGMYSILKRKDIEANGGHFTGKQVYDIWERENYSFNERSLLLGLMVKDSFEVAYEIPGRSNEYIAPQLLPLVRPNFVWDKVGALHFRYLYPFMPKGILTRLIVRLHELIKYQDGMGLVWRTGVVLENLGCTAKIEETKIASTGQQVITIEVTGYAAHRKLLLYDICRAIEGIQKDAFSKIVFERQVPCNCDYCKNLENPSFFDYSELMQYIDDEIAKIRCKIKPKHELEIDKLLRDIFDVNFTILYPEGQEVFELNKINRAVSEDPFGTITHPRKHRKLFISYSKHDEEYKEEFRKHLVTLKEQKLISSFNCKEIDLGADWDETIQRELDECDIVICLVSVDFLNTDYIRKYEVDKAMKKGKQVIPIIIKPCDWENSNIGKLFAPNRGKNISLDQELFLRNIIKETTAIERAAWWVAIVKEMREKLFK